MRLLSILAFMIVLGFGIIKGIQFDKNCGGYLERAVNANTIEMAVAELDVALNYMEAHNLTHGYTSFVYETPDEDIGFWYKNIKTARAELALIKPDASPLEKSNVLMKLRESLTANGESGDRLVVPAGISLHPNNTMYALFLLIFGMAAGLSVALTMVRV